MPSEKVRNRLTPTVSTDRAAKHQQAKSVGGRRDTPKTAPTAHTAHTAYTAYTAHTTAHAQLPYAPSDSQASTRPSDQKELWELPALMGLWLPR